MMNALEPSRNRARLKAVYTVTPGERPDRPLFRRIGTAFLNRDASLSIVLDALPVSGRLHVRDCEAGFEPAREEAITCNA